MACSDSFGTLENLLEKTMFARLIPTDTLKHWLVTTLCASVLGYFLCYGLLGDRGLLAQYRLQNTLVVAKAELQRVQETRQTLENRTRLLRPDHLDLDMLDERARALLGYTKPNEYVILLDPDKK